jgi:hypothetical protein
VMARGRVRILRRYSGGAISLPRRSIEAYFKTKVRPSFSEPRWMVFRLRRQYVRLYLLQRKVYRTTGIKQLLPAENQSRRTFSQVIRKMLRASVCSQWWRRARQVESSRTFAWCHDGHDRTDDFSRPGDSMSGQSGSTLRCRHYQTEELKPGALTPNAWSFWGASISRSSDQSIRGRRPEWSKDFIWYQWSVFTLDTCITADNY